MNTHAQILLAGIAGLLIGTRYSRNIDSFSEENFGIDLAPNPTPLSNLFSSPTKANNSDQLITALLIAGLGYIAFRELK